eukprot:SAG11_NODE_24_length_24699_cov_10.132195_9_plen_116_part_00
MFSSITAGATSEAGKADDDAYESALDPGRHGRLSLRFEGPAAWFGGVGAVLGSWISVLACAISGSETLVEPLAICGCAALAWRRAIESDGFARLAAVRQRQQCWWLELSGVWRRR